MKECKSNNLQNRDWKLETKDWCNLQSLISSRLFNPRAAVRPACCLAFRWQFPGDFMNGQPTTTNENQQITQIAPIYLCFSTLTYLGLLDFVGTGVMRNA